VKRSSIIIFLLLSIAVFTALAVYGDTRAILGSLMVLSPVYWLGVVGLILLHILVRLLRWNYYLRVLGVTADSRISGLVFLAGVGLIIVPGRVGELAKSYYLKRNLNVPVRLSVPIIVTERIADVVAVLFLGLWGLIFIPFGWAIIAATVVGIALLIFFLASPSAVELLVRLPLLRKWKSLLLDSGQALRTLLSPKVTLIGLVSGCFAWFIIGLSFWMVLEGLGSGVAIPAAVSIFSASTLIGSITMLPAGLVSTEASMLAMLQHIGLTSVIASASILIIRVCGLWLALIIGFAALLYLQKRQPAQQQEATPADEVMATATTVVSTE
jgi:uncharacterized membrane protein YbhN (UPF0104 family)